MRTWWSDKYKWTLLENELWRYIAMVESMRALQSDKFKDTVPQTEV